MLRQANASLLIFDYRGYGGSEGAPTLEGVVQDTNAAYRWLTGGNVRTPPEKIILFGESLGGALAVDLACREPVGGVILESTFTSLRDLAQKVYPFVPSRLVPDVYRSREIIRGLTAPLLVIHGTDDEIVPFSMGQALFGAAPHPKRFYAVPGAHHNDVPAVGGREYLRQIEEFLNAAGL